MAHSVRIHPHGLHSVDCRREPYSFERGKTIAFTGALWIFKNIFVLNKDSSTICVNVRKPKKFRLAKKKKINNARNSSIWV